MTDPTTRELAERLRAAIFMHHHHSEGIRREGGTPYPLTVDEELAGAAADRLLSQDARLTAQAEENERLREALAQITALPIAGREYHEVAEIARAALTQPKGDDHDER